MTARLILVRHGEPLDHAGRCIGHTDTALAPSAASPLRRLAESIDRARAPHLVLTSDLRRAADSAALLAGVWRAELRFDPRLREMAFGDWDGRSWDDVANSDRDALDAWGADWTNRAPPNGETGAAVASRAKSALDEIVNMASRSSSAIAVVSHAGWIRIATTILLGDPVSSAFERTIGYARAAVFTIREASISLDAWDVTDAGALQPTPTSARL